MPAARRPRPLLFDAAFAVLLALLLADVSRTAFLERHLDEDACMAVGWALSRGLRLYADVFSHHMPTDYLPAWAVAKLFGPRPAAFRAAMVAAWAACAAGVWLALRRGGDRARLTAALFAVLSSQWLTYWGGQFMLVENMWAWATVALVAVLGFPLDEDPGVPGRLRLAAAGALLAFLLTASLAALGVFACLAAWTLRDRRWRAGWPWLGAGAAAWLAVFLGWSAGRVAWSLWWADAVRFNFAVYSKAMGGWSLAVFHIAGSGLERYFDVFVRAVLLWRVVSLAASRRREDALGWAALALAVSSRGEHYELSFPVHAAPLYAVAALACAAELSRLWEAARPRGTAFAAAGALGAALVLAPTIAITSDAELSLRRFSSPSPERAVAAEALSRCAPPGPIAVLPLEPRLYLESGRLPALPGIFYLPWQAQWPEQRRRAAAAMDARLPAAVLYAPKTIWGHEWPEYASDLQASLERGYAPAAAWEAPGARPWVLYARKEQAPEVARCAAALTPPTARR